MNGCTAREAILSVSFLPPLLMGSTIKRKNLLLKEQILSFKSKPLFEVLNPFREANMKSIKLFPFLARLDELASAAVSALAKSLTKFFM